MKAISVKQPWAQLICLGIKPIENRTWPTQFRGRVYIHASQNRVKGSLEDILTDDQYRSAIDFAVTDQSSIVGAIIGEVDIIDCVLNHTSIWAEHSAIKVKVVAGIKTEIEVPVYNWVLANPLIYKNPIINVKGALSFWEYSKR